MTERDGTRPLIAGRLKLSAIARLILGIPLEKGFSVELLVALAVALALFFVLSVTVTWLFVKGVGVFGLGIPIAWCVPITNFVWWVGIAHAGTFISAFLYLLHQRWRASINRFAETITLFAIVCAGMFPLLHLGRPQYFYWIVPYPNSMGIWPQFRSALVWDFFAVCTYLTVSALFWYMGIIPDLASARDRARGGAVKRFYAVLCLGWRGAGSHWRRYKKIYVLMAGLATPLVISVHTVVSFDFAISILPGWHSAIFPPYFVAGAIFSGFAMLFTLMLPIRARYRLGNIITATHLDRMAKITLVTGLVVCYGYLMETFIAWYSGNIYERFHAMNQLRGPYGRLYWTVLFCNAVCVQTLWVPRLRRSAVFLFLLSIAINVGMWTERLMIIMVSLHRDFLPSAWAPWQPTIWDLSVSLGSAGLFLVCFLIFFRVFPMVASFEVEELAADMEMERARE